MGYVPSGNEGRHRILRKLRKEGAMSALTAREFEPKNRLERKALERALRCGVVKRTEKGAYWVDQDRVAEVRTKELRFVGTVLLAVLLLFGILFILGEFP